MNAVDKAIQYCGGLSEFARRMGVKPPSVKNWKLKPIPAIRCVQIEKVTEGTVSRKELRPNDWALIWPELENSDQ